MDWQTKVLSFFAPKSKLIIYLFWIEYFAITAVTVLGLYLMTTQGPLFAIAYELGIKFGQFSLILLGIVVMPGILGRFHIEIKVTRLITLFRRQLGITVFLLALSHFLLVRLVQSFLGNISFFLYDIRETLGLLAFILLLCMFLTSNDWSVSHLKVWWKRLHRIIYLTLWLVALHVALIDLGLLAIYIFGIASLEVISLVFDMFNKKKSVPPVQKPLNTQQSPTTQISQSANSSLIK